MPVVIKGTPLTVGLCMVDMLTYVQPESIQVVSCSLAIVVSTCLFLEGSISVRYARIEVCCTQICPWVHPNNRDVLRNRLNGSHSARSLHFSHVRFDELT